MLLPRKKKGAKIKAQQKNSSTAAMTMTSVGKAANEMVTEIRRQFGVMREALTADTPEGVDLEDVSSWPTKIEHKLEQNNKNKNMKQV